MDVRLFHPQAQKGEPAHTIIYRPLTGLAFVGNRALADIALRVGLKSGGSDTTVSVPPAIDAYFQSIGFYDPDPSEPAPIVGPYQPTTVVLLLTNQCQLRCTYCYAAAGVHAPESLSLELGYSAIDHVAATAQAIGRTRFELALHGGGEPTSAWRAMQQFVNYAKQKPLPVHVSVTSNGIWSRSQRDWLIANIDSFSISLDGSPETQDRQRPFISNRGSSDFVMQSVHALDRSKKPYGIRMTATFPWSGLEHDIDYLCRHTSCNSFQVEPAFNQTRGGHEPGSSRAWRDFAEVFVAAYHTARQHNRRLTYSGARVGPATSTFCTAPYKALIVNPRGRLVTCYEITDDQHHLVELSTIGTVQDGRCEIDDAARNTLHGMMAERRRECRDCPCYWSCAGDCYARTFGSDAGSHLTYGPRCEANRYITEQILLADIAIGAGVRRSVTVRQPPQAKSPG